MINPSDIRQLNKTPSKRTKTLTHIINLPIFGTFLYNLLTRRDKIAQIYKNEYFYDASLVTDNMINTYYETAHSGNASSKYLFSSKSGRYTTINIKHCLKSLNNSIFIIAGSAIDNIDERLDLYKEILPSIEIEKIDNCRHLPQMERPEKLLDLLYTLLI